MLELDKIYNMDCMNGLKEIQTNSIDCIITDPPYNVLAVDWDKQKIDWNILSKELFRILKDHGSLFVFCQMPMNFEFTVNDGDILHKYEGKFSFKEKQNK